MLFFGGITCRYGIHSVPFADIGCMKVFQETSDGKSPDLNIYFWDDDDAKWHLVCHVLLSLQFLVQVVLCVMNSTVTCAVCRQNCVLRWWKTCRRSLEQTKSMCCRFFNLFLFNARSATVT
mgnify:CR=1 FL=1